MPACAVLFAIASHARATGQVLPAEDEVTEPAEPGRRTAGFRTSGLVVSSLGGIRSREKMVWDWPDPADRIVEDLR